MGAEREPLRRCRVSPQQLQLIALAAREVWGLDTNRAYSIRGVAKKWDRREPVPDKIRSAVHRSLRKLVAGGFLRFERHRKHECKSWHLTIKGKALADAQGFPCADPAPLFLAAQERHTRLRAMAGR